MTTEEREQLVRLHMTQNEPSTERMPVVWQRIARSRAETAVDNGWRGNRPTSAWDP